MAPHLGWFFTVLLASSPEKKSNKENKL